VLKISEKHNIDPPRPDHGARQGQVGRQVDPVQGGDRQALQEPGQGQPQVPERPVHLPLGADEAPPLQVPILSTFVFSRKKNCTNCFSAIDSRRHV
jgi:hypothetical protein